MSSEAKSIIQNTRSSASQARKVFRLLKSLNNVYAMHKLFCESSNYGDLDKKLIKDLEILIQAFWALYFVYDNQLLLQQLKILPGQPSDILKSSNRSNLAWFAADSSTLLLALLKLWVSVRNKSNFMRQIEDRNPLILKKQSFWGYFITVQCIDSEEFTEEDKRILSELNEDTLECLWLLLKVCGGVYRVRDGIGVC